MGVSNLISRPVCFNKNQSTNKKWDFSQTQLSLPRLAYSVELYRE